MATWAYLGNFGISWTTENEIKQTLEAAGHTVVPLQENELNIEQIVISANKADYFLWTRTPGYLHGDGFQMLDRITVPTISWHLDLYWGIKREMSVQDDPFWRSDYVLQPDGNVEPFKALNINAYWLPPGVNAAECNLVERPMQHDLIFVGSWLTYHEEGRWRFRMIEELSRRYPTFEKYPKLNEGAIRGQPLNELYQSTRVTIGDSLSLEGNKTYTSDRIFESTGRGAFLLYPDIEWLTTIFPKEIFYVQGDVSGVEAKIDYYLTHEKEREELRRTCYEITVANHTYANRLDQVMEIIHG